MSAAALSVGLAANVGLALFFSLANTQNQARVSQRETQQFAAVMDDPSRRADELVGALHVEPGALPNYKQAALNGGFHGASTTAYSLITA